MIKKIFYFTLLLTSVMFGSCKTSGETGQVIGVQDRPKWQNQKPLGMNYVKAGHLNVGQTDEDVNMSMFQKPKAVTIAGFYMDETEVTNNEYREFVYWVKDSIAHTALGHFWDPYGDGNEVIDWKSYPLDYTAQSPDSQDLEFLYYAPEDRINGKREIDVRNLSYAWDTIDKTIIRGKTAAEAYDLRDQIIKRDTVMIYPDTLVWVKDMEYSYNEPMAEGYFSHPAYDDYPVVGVTWKQAKAFANWSTKKMDIFNADANLTKKGKSKQQVLLDVPQFRLPTEYEFEYAARGGRIGATYPWGLNYIRTGKGCLLANFKPGRGDYAADGGFYTVPVGSYHPNDFGLYDMSGNVAEWTESAFIENAATYIGDMNPSITYDAKDSDPSSWKRKTIRGGSWKDIGYFLQTGVRDWEYQDSARSYIGFRRVASFRGRTLTDNK